MLIFVFAVVLGTYRVQLFEIIFATREGWRRNSKRKIYLCRVWACPVPVVLLEGPSLASSQTPPFQDSVDPTAVGGGDKERTFQTPVPTVSHAPLAHVFPGNLVKEEFFL